MGKGEQMAIDHVYTERSGKDLHQAKVLAKEVGMHCCFFSNSFRLKILYPDVKSFYDFNGFFKNQKGLYCPGH
jgi:hypothetical protein